MSYKVHSDFAGMLRPLRLVPCLLLFAGLSFGQVFSVGIKGGVSLTDSIEDTSTALIQDPGAVLRTYSNTNEFLIGPTVELHLPLGLSVEADGLYRSQNLTALTQQVSQSPSRLSNDFHSWEIPILAKYRFPIPLVKPYIDAGPSFRVVDTPFANGFSNNGITAGGGVELRLGRLRLGPELRFTHWSGDASNVIDSITSTRIFSNQNQAELLVGISF